MVRAIFKSVDMGAVARQLRIHPGMQGADFLFAVIASRHTDPTYVQFAWHPHRHQMASPIQEIDLGVGDGPTDGHAPLTALWPALPGGNVDGGFGRTIQIVQFST